jgi:outer membrane protein assembly factor BamE
MRRPLAIAACAALLAGCVYRIEIQQGNYVTQDQVQKLKTGMTRTEVRQALGTPLLQDVFHADRWDYYFSHAKGGKAGERKLFSVHFKDDKLASFTGDVQPPAPPPVGVPPPQVTR